MRYFFNKIKYYILGIVLLFVLGFFAVVISKCILTSNELLAESKDYYIINAYGMTDHCKKGVQYSCGAHLYECDSKHEYWCNTNVMEKIK